jgi:hypothetical protein
LSLLGFGSGPLWEDDEAWLATLSDVRDLRETYSQTS